jgi:hypothetical protein
MMADPEQWEMLTFWGLLSDGRPGKTGFEMRICPRCHQPLQRRIEVLAIRYLPDPPPAKTPALSAPAPTVKQAAGGAS